jgi:hypothetical protein
MHEDKMHSGRRRAVLTALLLALASLASVATSPARYEIAKRSQDGGEVVLSAKSPEARRTITIRYEPDRLPQRVREGLEPGLGRSSLEVLVTLAGSAPPPAGLAVKLTPEAAPSAARVGVYREAERAFQAWSPLLQSCPKSGESPCEERFTLLFSLSGEAAGEVRLSWRATATLVGGAEPGDPAAADQALGVAIE